MFDSICVYGSPSKQIDISDLFDDNLPVYKPGFKGIVLNYKNELLKSDSRVNEPRNDCIQLFFGHQPDASNFWILYTDRQFNMLYIVRGSDNEELFDELYEFLINADFSPDNYDRESDRVDTCFDEFAKLVNDHMPSTIVSYMGALLASIRKRWEMFHPGALYPERYHDEVMNYKELFDIMFTSNDVSPDPRENYQLLEYAGDQAGWSAMNRIFMDYLEQGPLDSNGQVIELNQNNITSMHRDLFSKNVQSKLARRMNVSAFIQKTEKVINKTYGDIFEAIVGAFYMIDYLISTRVRFEVHASSPRSRIEVRATTHGVQAASSGAQATIDGARFQLHVAFLKWAYDSIDLSEFDKKPYYTLFSENTIALFGNTYFRHNKNGDVHTTTFKDSDRKRLMEEAKTFKFSDGSTSDMSDVIKRIFDMVRGMRGSSHGHRAGQGQEVDYDDIDNERSRFDAINQYIEREFGSDELRNLRNLRKISKWTEEQQVRFLQLMDGVNYIISDRPTNKLKTSYYWIVETPEKEVLHSTANYTNSEDPDLLISIIEQGTSTSREATSRPLKYHDGYVEGQSYVYRYSQSKQAYLSQALSSRANDSDLESVLKADPTMKYHISIRANDTHHGYLVYSPYPSDVFVDGFDHEAFFDRFANSLQYRVEDDKLCVYYTRSDAPASSRPDARADRNDARSDTRTSLQSNTHVNPNVRSDTRSNVRSDIEYSMDMIPIRSYIGDRSLNKTYLTISLMRHGIMNEHHLTQIKDYYRDKTLKGYFSYLLAKHRRSDIAPRLSEDHTALSFDEYIGLDPDHFENSLYELFKNVKIDDSYIEPVKRKLIKIRNAIDGQIARIQHEGDTLFYIASNGVKLVCPIGHRNSIMLTDLFGKYVIDYEYSFGSKEAIRNRMNNRYRHIKSFEKLRQVMQIRNVTDWEIVETPKLDMRYTLKYKERDGYRYITEKSFDEIIKIMTGTRY